LTLIKTSFGQKRPSLHCSRLNRLQDPIHVVGNPCVDTWPALQSAAVAEGDHALLVPELLVRPPHQRSARVTVTAVPVELATDAELGADEMDISCGELSSAGIVVVHRKIQTLLDGALAGCKIKHLINKHIHILDVASIFNN